MRETSVTRAWFYLVWLSFQRHARAHLMVWIALGLLGLSLLIVGINAQAGRFTMARFSDLIVFALFTTFLLPLWSIAFATEGLGREREASNLLWVLTRPIPRSAIFLAKYVALVPWCMLMNLGGFALLCLAGGQFGRQALAAYWPAVFFATLAFSALFHLIGACLRRAAVIALLYAFFLETLMGNMPGHFKRLSISFYTRCLMFERAHELGIHADRPSIYLPVNGLTAALVLAGVTVACLVIGAIVFTRNEYLDVN